LALILALLSALTYGSGDFFGGLAAKKMPPMAVALGTSSVVIVPLAMVSAIVGAERVGQADMAWGVLGGVVGAVGLMFLYTALARGPMTVAAPITAVVAAAVPVLVGTLTGDRPSWLQWIGIATAFAAIVTVSNSGGDSGHRETSGEVGGANLASLGGRLPIKTVVASLLAGASFGLYFVALANVEKGAGLWPLVGGKIAATLIFCALIMLAREVRRSVDRVLIRTTMPLIAISGALDVTANVTYLISSRTLLLTVAAVITSLYPAATVVLANRVLKERIGPVQAVGLVLAVSAIAAVALG
jgi:drug/metabolite transporter (DMT)-like permease